MQILFIIILVFLKLANTKAIYDFTHTIASGDNAIDLEIQFNSIAFYILDFVFCGVLLAIVIFQFRWFKAEDKTVICNIIVIVSTVIVFILSLLFTGFVPMLLIGPFYLLGAIFCLIAFWKLEI